MCPCSNTADSNDEHPYPASAELADERIIWLRGVLEQDRNCPPPLSTPTFPPSRYPPTRSPCSCSQSLQVYSLSEPVNKQPPQILLNVEMSECTLERLLLIHGLCRTTGVSHILKRLYFGSCLIFSNFFFWEGSEAASVMSQVQKCLPVSK